MYDYVSNEYEWASPRYLASQHTKSTICWVINRKSFANLTRMNGVKGSESRDFSYARARPNGTSIDPFAGLIPDFSLPEWFDPCQTSRIIGADGLYILRTPETAAFSFCRYLNSAVFGMLLHVCVARSLRSHELNSTTAGDALAAIARSPHYYRTMVIDNCLCFGVCLSKSARSAWTRYDNGWDRDFI